MADLFIQSGAIFADDRKSRLKLWRIWDDEKPLLIMIMMNPSTADETNNDPTVQRCVQRAMANCYGGVYVYNLLSCVETESRNLAKMKASDLCSNDNIHHLNSAIRKAKEGKGDILCAWGRPGQKYGPVLWFAKRAREENITLFCLGINKDGSPKHPLYIPYSQLMCEFDLSVRSATMRGV